MEPSGFWGILESIMLIALAIAGAGMWISIFCVIESGTWLKSQFSYLQDDLAKICGL